MPVYEIKSLLNKPIIGTFYEKELEKVIIDDKTEYKIDKIIKEEKMNGVDGFIIQWLGWGKAHNSWVKAENVHDIDKYMKR